MVPDEGVNLMFRLASLCLALPCVPAEFPGYLVSPRLAMCLYVSLWMVGNMVGTGGHAEDREKAE